jgi:NitT/TauT family transport system substrate-binding protein
MFAKFPVCQKNVYRIAKKGIIFLLGITRKRDSKSCWTVVNRVQLKLKQGFFLACLSLLFLFNWGALSWGETTLKVGVLRLANSAPVFIGIDKGYFAAEGIRIEPLWFKAAQPIAVATATGDVDVGASGLTAGLYNAIAQGMRIAIVADKGREWPGYRLTALMVHTETWKAGVRDLKGLKGKRVGITQMGSTYHYLLGNLIEKAGMALQDIKMVPLGSINSMRDALIAQQIEGTFLNQPHVTAAERNGTGNVLLWVGDYLPYQIAAIFFGEKLMKERPAAISFMRGYIRSCRHYYDYALARKEGGAYQDILNLVSRYTEEKPEAIASALPFNDRNGELYGEDIQTQLDWYHRHGLLAQKMSSTRVVDLSFWKEALEKLGK